jgi:hypothetical protein
MKAFRDAEVQLQLYILSGLSAILRSLWRTASVRLKIHRNRKFSQYEGPKNHSEKRYKLKNCESLCKK